MHLKQRRLIARLVSLIYTGSIPEPTNGTLAVSDDEVLLELNGSFKRLKIQFTGNLFIYNKLPDGYSIIVKNNIININNILLNQLPNDNIIFKFDGSFSPTGAQVTTLNGNKIILDISDVNRLDIINYSKTNPEDSSLIFIEGEDEGLDRNEFIKSGIDDDSIKGLYTDVEFADGYTGYYNYHPKEKIYMTGKRQTNQSVPIQSTKRGFNVGIQKKALNKILNRIAITGKATGLKIEETPLKREVKTIEKPVKKQQIVKKTTKGGKY